MRLYIFTLLLFAHHLAVAQCDPYISTPKSKRTANYDIRVALNHATKTIDASQTVRFVNSSPAPISHLRFYMYLNAFKNTESTFLKGAANIFGQGFTDRKADEWGWIQVDRIRQKGPQKNTDLSAGMHYIQPDDGNPADQSVLEVQLSQPLPPGQSAEFELIWRAKMPKTIARAGYSQDFYLFCHWFPQLGVFEQNQSGIWDWNCHQFMRSTEFYADFGVYDVHITTDKNFVLGATGCLVDEKNNSDGTITRHYHAEDVIDFAWSADPRFRVLEDRWKDVHIRLLISPEHAYLGHRYLYALKFALTYMEQHLAPYPHPSITVVDPPFHGLRSGLMEYPMLVTVGTFYGMPAGVRTMESLVVHEFLHQYFMGIVGSNEKEEPWLDEGFVTYFEDRVIDAAFGRKNSLIDFYGICIGNRELSRTEYTAMANPREGAVARPAWMFTESNRKSLIYSKTATSLRSVQELVGEEKMDEILKAYFEKWKFGHPRGADFMASLKQGLTTLPDSAHAARVYDFFETAVYQSFVLDYAVTGIWHETLPAPQGLFGDQVNNFTYKDGSAQGQVLSKVEVQRKGEWVFPVEILITFEDGSTKTIEWSGQEGIQVFDFEGPQKVVSACIDPQQKIGLDVDLNNNSLTLKPQKAPLWKYATRAVFWIQNLMQSLSFLV